MRIFSLLKPKVTYANVLSTACLFIVLGGTSYAVSRLPKNSVDSRAIKNRSITSADIRPGAIGKQQLHPNLRKFFGSTSSTGSPGPTGPAGPAGPQGPSGSSQIRWAAINGVDGSVLAGRGVAAAKRLAAGVYEVTFNESVEKCYPSATLSAERGFIAAVRSLSDPKSFVTSTRNSTDVTADRSFVVQALCTD